MLIELCGGVLSNYMLSKVPSTHEKKQYADSALYISPQSRTSRSIGKLMLIELCGDVLSNYMLGKVPSTHEYNQ